MRAHKRKQSIVYWKRISNDSSQQHEKEHEIIVNNDDPNVFTVVSIKITMITNVIIKKRFK